MGHMTTCLAYANRLREHVRPVFFSLASAVEMIHAMASSDKPPKLVTRSKVIDGESYVIIPEGADQVVRTRGIARKARRQVAEQTLKLTTMRKR